MKKFWKIKNKSTGLFYRAYTLRRSSWGKIGKSYGRRCNAVGALNYALKDCPDDEIIVVEYETVQTGTFTAEKFKNGNEV